MPGLAFAGLTILDLTHHIAGPYCTKLFADYGADVIKIERPDGGDPARRAGPFPDDIPHPEKSGLFLHLNTNKLGVTLDLKSATGRKVFLDLVRQVDVVVENFAPRVMPTLGLDWETLREVNPRLVMTSISNFGQTGPYRDWKATELTIFAMGTRMVIHGQPDLPPVKYAGNAMQYLVGNKAALATLMALIGSRFQGIGRQVDISMMEAIANAADGRLTIYSFTLDDPMRSQSGGAITLLPAKDGFVQFPNVTGAGRQWPRFLALIERPDLADDPRFATPTLRTEHRAELEAIYLPWIAARSKREVAERAQALRVFAAPVLNVEEVVTDPHFKERGFFTEITHPEAGTFTYPGAPIKMTETPWTIRRPAPTLGQHNAEVYGERLGFTAEDLARLRGQGVI